MIIRNVLIILVSAVALLSAEASDIDVMVPGGSVAVPPGRKLDSTDPLVASFAALGTKDFDFSVSVNVANGGYSGLYSSNFPLFGCSTAGFGIYRETAGAYVYCPSLVNNSHSVVYSSPAVQWYSLASVGASSTSSYFYLSNVRSGEHDFSVSRSGSVVTFSVDGIRVFETSGPVTDLSPVYAFSTRLGSVSHISFSSADGSVTYDSDESGLTRPLVPLSNYFSSLVRAGIVALGVIVASAVGGIVAYHFLRRGVSHFSGSSLGGSGSSGGSVGSGVSSGSGGSMGASDGSLGASGGSVGALAAAGVAAGAVGVVASRGHRSSSDDVSFCPRCGAKLDSFSMSDFNEKDLVFQCPNLDCGYTHHPVRGRAR